MSLTHRQEGFVLLGVVIFLLIVLLGLLSSSLMWDVPNIIVATGSPFIAAVCGAIIPISLRKLTHPELSVKSPRVVRVENHSMGMDPIYVRVPVTAKRGSINNVYAEVVEVELKDEDEYNRNTFTNGDFSLRGTQKLFWADHYEPHSDVLHKGLNDAIEVLEHMNKKHLSAAGPIEELDARDEEYANVIMKVEGLPETFLADSIGTAGGRYSDAIEFCSNYDRQGDVDREFTAGEFKCEIKIGGEGVKSKITTISFRTGPSILDLSIPN